MADPNRHLDRHFGDDPERVLEETSIRGAVQALLADRRSPEARALYLLLARYIDRRTGRVMRRRYSDLLGAPDHDELVGEVLLELMSGSLASFRGDSIASLLAFVRRVADRAVWRAAHRRIKERDALKGDGEEAVRRWMADTPSPDELVKLIPDCPLDEKDERYLVDLLQAGTRAEHARREGVSRAAVTQRVQRIRRRIEKLSPKEQRAAEAWMRSEARRVAANRGG